MTKDDAISLIDAAKNELVNPVDLLHWVWLRVIINSIAPDEWEELIGRACEVMSK